MEKVANVSTASKYEVKMMIDDLDRSQDALSEAMKKIEKFFNDMREYQDSLAA